MKNRRHFLQGASSLGLLALLPGCATDRRPRIDSYPFTLGVASGDPAADGFVIWTRLAPEPLTGGGMPDVTVDVHWEVGADEAFGRIVRAGVARAAPELAHSVHVEVDGLSPDRWYWYRFRIGDALSPVGRTRTMPAAGAMPSSLNLAYVSCQHYEAGFYNGYRDMADGNPDLIIHLGDYIYETPASDQPKNYPKVRSHIGPRLHTLEDYRNRYALYKTDTDLQRAHATAPWLVTWDDHEVQNNFAADTPQTKWGFTRDEFMALRARAAQAYYEHMPLRRASMPNGPWIQLYRGTAFGRLAAFNVLDTRQYRSDQPCDGGKKPRCDGVFSEAATMLGAAQEAWLSERLTSSPATWNVLAQQIVMASLEQRGDSGSVWSMDSWAGYEMPRRRMLSLLDRPQVANPVVLTGDIHRNIVNELRLDQDDLSAPMVAPEFVCTSISSGGNGVDKVDGHDEFVAANPCVRFLNDERGYVRCRVTPDAWHTEYRVAESVTDPEAPCFTRRRFAVEAGHSVLHDET